MLCAGTLLLILLCCSAQGLDVQGYEGGTALLPLSSFPEFDSGKDLYLVIVRENGDVTRVLNWQTRTLLWTAEVLLPQFEGRMSLIRGPSHQGLPHAVQIRNMRPADSVTDGYFQFQQPGGAQGQEMGLRVFAITVTASPNPATIAQQVTLTCSVDGGRPNNFTWTHEGQAIPGTQDAQGNPTASFTVEPNSGGSYVCNVNGSFWQGQKSIVLQIVPTMTTTMTTPSSTPRKTTAFTTASSVLSSTGETFSVETFVTSKTTNTASHTLGAKPVQHPNSPRESQGFGTAAIIACVLGGLILVLIAIVGTCFWKRRKKSTSEENAVIRNTGQQPQETILHHVNELGAGTRAQIDLQPLSLPIPVSSLRSSYEEEQNTINSRRPLMPKQRPTLLTSSCGPFQPARLDGAVKSVARSTPVNSLPDQSLHLDEVTSVHDRAAPPQASEDNTDPKAASSARPVKRSTGQQSSTNTRRALSNASSSVSLDESTATNPHSLRSDQPNFGRCPSLEDMISYDTGSETTQNNIPTNQTNRPSNGQNKKLQHPKKATSCRESTQETMMEDTMEEHGGGGQVCNREGRRSRVTASDLRALSLSGNEVATTIDQMIRKVLVDEGNLDIPYRKFSELCLQLYNTQNNWKVLADRLGLTNGDILLIDNCSTQHNLLAAEIVLRHWQRTSRQDRTTPCTVQNLRTILQDMGREDLVDMLQK